MNSQFKIAFFGTSDFAVPILKALFKNGYNITAVVTTPNEPIGRKQTLTPPPIKLVAQELGLTVLQPPSLKIDKFKTYLEIKNLELEIDLGIVASYGKIIPSQYLEMPRYGFLNIHPSLLPKYRGPSPIQTTIMKGDKKTGVTIIKLDEKVDHGPVLARREFSILPTPRAVCKAFGDAWPKQLLRLQRPGNFQFSNQKELERELAKLGAELLIEILPQYIIGKIEAKPQEHEKATFTKLLTREDGRIDWNKTAEEIYNQILALHPEPGTWTIWQDKILNIIEVNHIEVKPQYGSHGLGEVVRVNNEIAVTTKKCYLILKQIQLEGGKEMGAKAFLNGHPDFLGSKLG